MPDPLEALRRPEEPLRPDPTFASDLRRRLIEALLARSPGDRSPHRTRTDPKDAPMTSTHVSDRNGRSHGDLSYLTLAVPDVARGQHFYAELLGWDFGPGRYQRQQGLQVVPQIGMYDGAQPDGRVLRGAVLCYRVDDIAAAVEAVRAGGGQAEGSQQRAYGLESLAADPDGNDFYLHQIADSPDPSGSDLPHGRQHGDVAYFSLGVADLARAERFYGSLLGWRFSAEGGEQGRQISGVNPMGGLWVGEHRGAVISYRVEDIEVAARRIVELGGTASTIDSRPYGLAADYCTDDQGLTFGLLQLS